MKDLFDLIGRVLLSFIFLHKAYEYIAYFKEKKVEMSAYGITWNQDLLLYGAIFLLFSGGIMLLTGYRSRLGAMLLLLYWVPVTLVVHSFWNDPPEFQHFQSVQFTKNLAIAGGLMMASVNSAGKHSIRRLFATYRVKK